MTKKPLSPKKKHLSDPYVIQLIEALSKQMDEIENLEEALREIQLLAGEGCTIVTDRIYDRANKALQGRSNDD